MNNELKQSIGELVANHYPEMYQPMVYSFLVNALKNMDKAILSLKVNVASLTLPKRLNVEDVKKEVCKYYNISWDKIMSKSREGNIVEARHAFIFICITHAGIKPIQLARLLQRDHTSISYVQKKMKGFKDINDRAFQDISAIIEKFEA